MRTRALLAALLFAALWLSACGGDDPGAATAAPEDGCGEVEHPAEQSGGHLLADATPPVPYSSVPPTSGWHASGFPERGVHGQDDALGEPEQVTILELGGVVITWNGLESDEREILERFVAEHAEVVAATPYDKLPEGQVALAAWGVLRHCGSVDVEAMRAFVDEHSGGGPDH